MAQINKAKFKSKIAPNIKTSKVKVKVARGAEARYQLWLRKMMADAYRMTIAEYDKFSTLSLKTRQDASIADTASALFTKIKAKFNKKYNPNVRKNEAQRVAKQVNEYNRADQARMLNAQTKGNVTKGAILEDDIILSTTSKSVLTTASLFVKENVGLIKTIPNRYFSEIESTVMRGYQEQRRWTDISADIRKRYDVSKSRADLIGRDQVNKLNGNLARDRQEGLGIKKYQWVTAGDERVRSDHASKNGKIFSWDDPPAGTGHPGQDYRCRCVAVAVHE